MRPAWRSGNSCTIACNNLVETRYSCVQLLLYVGRTVQLGVSTQSLCPKCLSDLEAEMYQLSHQLTEEITLLKGFQNLSMSVETGEWLVHLLSTNAWKSDSWCQHLLFAWQCRWDCILFEFASEHIPSFTKFHWTIWGAKIARFWNKDGWNEFEGHDKNKLYYSGMSVIWMPVIRTHLSTEQDGRWFFFEKHFHVCV